MFGLALSYLNYVSPDMSMGLTGRSVCSISDLRYAHLVGIRNNRGCCLVRIFAEDIFRHLRPGDIVTVAFDYTPSSPLPASSHDIKYRGLLAKCVLTN